MFGLDVLVSVANIIYLASYSVRDILWLRIFTVFGASLLMPYYYWQSHPLWTPIAWNLVFVAINLVWIFQLLRERRPVHFTDEERQMYETALSNLKPHDAAKLLRSGEYRDASQGTLVIEQDKFTDRLMLISKGYVDVTKDDVVVDELGSGCFLGAAAYLAHSDQFKAPISIKAREPTRFVVWHLSELDKLMERNADLKIALEANLGRELARNLSNARARIVNMI